MYIQWMQFLWDELKNRKNILKHGIDFKDAVEIFSHPMLTNIDCRFDYGEERWQKMKVKSLKRNSDTDWERLSTMSDKDIDLSDNPELGNDFFTNATLRMPEPKKAVSLRIDKDVLEWYKTRGPGYQTRINAVLRMYMQAKNATATRKRARRCLNNRKMPKK